MRPGTILCHVAVHRDRFGGGFRQWRGAGRTAVSVYHGAERAIGIATELLANCQPGSLAFELFKRVADTAQPVFQTLDMDDRFDEPEEAEEE
jgi:hypothetical protein